MADEPILEYAKGVPRWQAWVRRGLWVLGVMAVVWSGWRFGPRVYGHGVMLVRQRECMNYTVPAGTVVFEGNEKLGRALLASRGCEYVEGNYSEMVWKGGQWNAEMRVPACALAIRDAASSWVFWSSSPILFLHGRTSRGAGGGKERLVEVYFSGGISTDRGTGFEFAEGHALKLGNLLDNPEQLRAKEFSFDLSTHCFASPPTTPLNLRIYAGVADEKDKSHFTIEYEQWGQRDVADGWLEADDKVTMTCRNPPKNPEEVKLIEGGAQITKLKSQL